MKAEISPFRNHPYRSFALTAALIAVAMTASVSLSWRVPGLELNARDWLMRTRGNLPPSAELVIIAIDEASLARYGRFPWPRRLMAQALAKISAAHPRAIALDVLYTDVTNEADDQALAAAITAAGNVVVAAQLTKILSDAGTRENVWLRPLPALEQAAAGVGHVNIATGFDGVARALQLRQVDDEAEPRWAMAVETIRVGQRISHDALRELPNDIQLGRQMIPVNYEAPNIVVGSNSADAPFAALRAAQIWLDFIGPTGSFAAQTISFSDVIEGRLAPEKLRDKYVLIGATAAAMGDRVASPFAQADVAGDAVDELMPGVEVLANAMNTILERRFYRESSAWEAALLAALVALATVLLLNFAQGRFEAAKHLLALTGLLGAVLGASYFAFTQWLIFPPLVPMLTALLVAAPLTLLQRSLTVSANIDWRIAELSQASAELLSARSTALSVTNGAARAGWHWPRGGEGKAQQLGAIAGQLLAQARFVEQSLLAVEDGLIVADVNGRITFANRRAGEILNRQPHGLRALAGAELFEALAEAEGRKETNAPETLRRLLIERSPVEREIELGPPLHNAAPRHYTLRMAPVLDGAGQAALGLVASLADITRQRELHQARNDVMTLVTHELKTPLTAIQAMSEVLVKYNVDTARSDEMHLAINDEAKRLAALIDEYLSITRLETGAQSLRLTTVRPAQLIERTLLLLDPLAAQRAIRLIRRLAPNLPPLLVDADLLARVFTNLVANAIKFSPEKSEVIIAAVAADGDLRIEVSDSGCGIPAETLPRIFEKFYRVPRTLQSDADVPGNGLGLALVREIAEQHGGRVTVASEVGVGSVFTLHLPLRNKILS